MTANALETLSFTLGSVVGPMLAGLLIAVLGAPNVLWLHHLGADAAHAAHPRTPARPRVRAAAHADAEWQPHRRGALSCLVAEEIATPLRPMLAVASARGLCLLEFLDRRALSTELRQVRERFRVPIIPRPLDRERRPQGTRGGRA